MYAKVIPLTKLPRRLDFFDYKIPSDLETKTKIGHQVVVYFRNRKIYGIVIEIADKTTAVNKKIQKIEALTDIVLPKSLLDLLSWASDYYLASPALFYKFFVPQITKARTKEKPLKKQSLSFSKKDSNELLSSLKKTSGGTSFFLYHKNLKQTLGVFIKLAQKALRKDNQALLLVPSLKDIELFAPYLNNIFEGKLVLWHSKLSQGEKFTLWQRISNKEPLVIVGTRPAVFLPFRKLSLSFIYNSSSSDHKQWDQNPRYDAKAVLNKLGGTIVLSDSLPDLKIFKKIEEKKVIPLNSPLSKITFSLVDIKKEKKSPSPLLSFPLYEMIKNSCEKNKQVILFLNRKKGDSLMICRDCNYVFKCADCGSPLNIDNDKFLCYHCNIKKDIESACPNCKNSNLKPLKPGIESFKKILEHEFPKIKVQTKISGSSVALSDADVIVTTDYFWKNLLPQIKNQSIYGAAILDFDFYLARPEFNQKEVALNALYRFLQFTTNLQIKNLIQTACPEHPIFEDWRAVYKDEIKERHEINYPPFSLLIKIICKEHDKEELEINTKKLYNELKEGGFSALPPFEPYIKKRTTNYLRHIILKEDLTKDLTKLKQIVPDTYQIDVDPISIY